MLQISVFDTLTERPDCFNCQLFYKHEKLIHVRVICPFSVSRKPQEMYHWCNYLYETVENK